MDKTYRLAEHHIHVIIEEGIIRIKNDIHLWAFLDKDIKQQTQYLVALLLSDYLKEYDKPLNIRPKSFAIEIWGHLYYEYLVLLSCRLFRINPASKKIKRLLASSDVIDCGEKDQDSNRFLWDLLTPFYGIIQLLLPNNIRKKNLKN